MAAKSIMLKRQSVLAMLWFPGQPWGEWTLNFLNDGRVKIKHPKTGFVFEAHFLVLLKQCGWLRDCLSANSQFSASQWYQYGQNTVTK